MIICRYKYTLFFLIYEYDITTLILPLAYGSGDIPPWDAGNFEIYIPFNL